MKTVQILGTAPNLHHTLPLEDKERWGCNSPGIYTRRWRDGDLLHSWTRWFNMHSRRHMLSTYRDWYLWYGDQVAPKRIVLQEVQPDIPVSEAFPKDAIMQHFGTRYFTNSASWFIALAIYEGFERIELSGFMLRRDTQHDFERPCFFYWVEEARKRGIEVVLPADLEVSPPGNPDDYTGPLYGYETT
jgi:hypothetical protein